MQKVLRTLEHHMVQYLIIAFFGVFAAYLFFQIGGSLAEVTGQEKSFGIAFKAGGGFGGFLLVFLLSVPVIARLRNLDQRARTLNDREQTLQVNFAARQQQLTQDFADREQQLRLRLAEEERTFQKNLESRFNPANDPVTLKLFFKSRPKIPHGPAYKCICSLYNEDMGTKMPVDVDTYWEAGYLAVTVKAVGRDDYLDVRVEGGGKAWSCDRFHATERVVELSPA